MYYLPNSSTALKPGYRERLLQIPDRILRNPDLHNYVVLGGTSLEWIKAGIKRFISVNLFSKPFELFWIKMPNCTPYLNVLKELVERPEHGISVSDLTRNDNGICNCLYRISRQIATAKNFCDFLTFFILQQFHEFFHDEFKLLTKLYIPSTLNIALLQWHTHLNVCAVK